MSTTTRYYLWRAVDQDGDVIDILVQPRRDQRAAKRFFRKLLKGQGDEPRRLVTDKLRSYSAAHRAVMPATILVGPRSHPESVQGRTASATARQPPDAAGSLLPYLV